MVDFIEQYRVQHGVEPICKLLPIAPSTYWRCKALSLRLESRCARAKREDQLLPEIQRVWEESNQNYGARKVYS